MLKDKIIFNKTMDLNQRKLNKSEWNSIEVPISGKEIEVLNMIIQGYSNTNIRINNNNSIFTFLKMKSFIKRAGVIHLQKNNKYKSISLVLLYTL